MTSKEALKEFYKCITDNVVDKIRGLHAVTESILSWIEKYYTIEKDLERLEKLEKALKILKDKKLNVYYIWLFDDYKRYEYYYPLIRFNIGQDMLTNEEFDLLKDVLYNGL